MSDNPIAEAKPMVFCQHIRSKSMYVFGSIEEAAQHSDAEHCWCFKTMKEFGPDEQLVNFHTCRPGRDCFEEL